MATSLMPNFNAYNARNIGQLQSKSDNVASVRSENNNKCESDYSLSDIEEGLDTSLPSATSKAVSPFRSTIEVESFFKYRNPDPLLLRAFVKDEELNKRSDENRSAGKRDTRKRLSSSESTHFSDHVKSRRSRRRSSGLNVKQETAMLGAKELTRQFTVSQKNSNLNNNVEAELFGINPSLKKNPESPESDRCLSPSDRPKSEVVADETKKSLEQHFEDVGARKRSQTLGTTPTTPFIHRSRSATLIERHNAVSSDSKAQNTITFTTSNVRKMKRYQRALAAYRKSAEKLLKKSNESSDKIGYHTLPLRGGRDIVDFWGTQYASSILESDDRVSESGKSCDRNSCSSDSTYSDDISTLRRWPFVPVTGDTRSRFGNEDSLSLDYRRVLRDGSLKKWKSDSPRNNPKRISIDPETVTDIDFMVGFGETSDCVTNTRQKDEKLTPGQSSKPSNGGSEKIVWSEYENYMQSRSNSVHAPRSSLKMRLAALEKKSSGHGPHEAAGLGEVSPEQNPAEEESPYVNLRHNQMIRKRNVIRTTSNVTHASSSLAKVPASRQSSAPTKFNTTSSPSKRSMFIEEQSDDSKQTTAKSNRTKQEQSPHLSRSNRASSLNAQTSSSSPKKAIFDEQELAQLSNAAMRAKSSRSLPRMKHPDPVVTPVVRIVEPPSDNEQSSPTKGLFLSRYKSSYANPNMYDKLREYSKCLSESLQIQNGADTKKVKATALTQSVKTASKELPSLHLPKSPDKEGSSDKQKFTPGAYTSAGAGSDSEDDYVSYDTFYNKKEQPSSKRVSPVKQAQRSPNRDTLRKLPLTRSMFYQGSSSSTLTLSRDKTGSRKADKGERVNCEQSKKSGDKTIVRRSVSASDIARHNVNQSKSQTLSTANGFHSIDRRNFFSSRDLFYGVARKQSKRKSSKRKEREISVPLTACLDEPEATYSLTLPRSSFDKPRKKERTLRRISSFINNESVSRLESLSDMQQSLNGVTGIFDFNKSFSNSGSA